MQSFSETSHTQSPEQMIRSNVEYLLLTGNQSINDQAPDAAIGFYALAFSLYFTFPYNFDADEQERFNYAQAKFLNLAVNNPITIQSPCLNTLLEFYPYYIDIRSRIISLSIAEILPLRKNNIDSNVRQQLADIWNILGTYFLHANQHTSSSACFQLSLIQIETLENYNLEVFAQNSRTCAHCMYLSATENTFMPNELIEHMEMAQSHLSSIPKQYKSAHDFTSCVKIQSTLTLTLLVRASQIAMHHGNILESRNHLELAITENTKLTTLVKTLQEQCANDHIKMLLEQSKIIHQLDYLALMKNVFNSNNEPNIRSVIYLTEKLLKAYRAFPAAALTENDSHEMRKLQKALIANCHTFINENLINNNLRTAFIHQVLLAEEYRLILTTDKTKQAEINYTNILREYSLTELEMTITSSDPYNDESLEYIDEAIEVSKQLSADDFSKKSDMEKVSHHEFLRKFTSLLTPFLGTLHTNTDLHDEEIKFREVIIAMLQSIPAKQRTILDRESISLHEKEIETLSELSDPSSIPVSPNTIVFSADINALHSRGFYASGNVPADEKHSGNPEGPNIRFKK